jgi:RNA polymerase sigma-70 factor (ECF subfamily)
MSELYEEVRQKASRFGRQNERPLTWLIFMAHRRAIERLCQRLTTQTEIGRKNRSKTKSTTASDSAINITEQRRLIRAAMNSIPGLQQEMIELTFFSGMTNLEIARKLGQRPEVVEDGLRSAMLKLFRLFQSMNFPSVPHHGNRTEVSSLST